MTPTSAYNKLIDDIVEMIVSETYNRAPVNYSIADKAAKLTIKFYRAEMSKKK